MKYISLFSGIGGIDLGLDRAGMECICQVEKDDFCQKVLYKHWPNVPKFKDVHDVGKHNLPSGADVIAAGFPCQPHSYAGKREASADERDLWPETARIIREYLPEWFLGENVPGLLSSEVGRFFGGVLRDLAASGYDVEWQSIPAAAFGAPHIRERVFILAHYAGERNREISVSAQRPQQNCIDANGLCGYVPDTNGDQHESGTHAQWGQTTNELSPNAKSNGWKSWRPELYFFGWPLTTECDSSQVPDTDRAGLSERETQQGTPIRPVERTGMVDGREAGHWSVEPAVGRVADGVPGRVDRLRALGGAVVPDVAEYLGLCIVQAQKRLTQHRTDSLPGSVSAGLLAR